MGISTWLNPHFLDGRFYRMIISNTNKFIFIFIPRTAGESIRRSLESFVETAANEVVEHISANSLRKRLGEKWNEYFTFAIIRNPWSRVVSTYLALKESENTKISNLFSNYSFEDFCFFSGFTRGLSSAIPLEQYDQLPAEISSLFANEFKNIAVSQKTLITDENDQIIVNYVAKYEDLKNEFPTIVSYLNLGGEAPPELENIAVLDYKEFYTRPLVQLITSAFMDDIDFFGFSFNSSATKNIGLIRNL